MAGAGKPAPIIRNENPQGSRDQPAVPFPDSTGIEEGLGVGGYWLAASRQPAPLGFADRGTNFENQEVAGRRYLLLVEGEALAKR